ncbi:MAG: MerR family DNA-binding protein [Aridibacter sp.]
MREEKTSDRFSKSLNVGEVSKLTDISISTLHYYEKIGLIEPPVRSRKGYRLFNLNSIERLNFIKKAKTLGFKLDEIRQIIEESKTGNCPCDTVRNTVQKRLIEVDKQIARMKKFRDELKDVVKGWDAKKISDSIICGLIEEVNIAS